MPVSVNMPTRHEPKDPLDTVVKGLQIAQSIYGIRTSMDAADRAKADQQLKQEAAGREVEQFKNTQAGVERQKLGQILPADAAGLTKDHNVYTSEVPNGQKLTILDPAGNRDVWVTAKSEVKPISDLEKEKTKAEIKKINAEAGKASAEKQKTLPATEAVALGSTNAAYVALEDAGKAFESNTDISGPMQGRLSAILAKGEIGESGKRAKTFDAQLKANAQIIGKSLEGGKLTDQDIDRYKQMLPNLNDSPEAARGKVSVLQNLLAQKQQAEQAALSQAGYDVGAITGSPARQNPNIRTQTSNQPSAIDVAKSELAGKSKDEQLEAIRKAKIKKAGIAGTLPKKGDGS
jgi:hypothetical protein